jgi:LmbE family N-acetylglucosaminyl deacetylase
MVATEFAGELLKPRSKSPRKPRAKAHNLIVVAHPDDETIFFGGLMQRHRTKLWTIVCMTDANADGDGRRRKKQFEKACRLQGVKDAQWWGFPDIYEKRLDISAMTDGLLALPKPHEVYTHGIIGEYGHPHHQDVSYAVHKAFSENARVYSAAYNTFPDFSISLTKKEFAKKADVLTQTYGSETSRFLNLLPATAYEGFLHLDLKEVEAVYDFFAHGKSLRSSDLRAYKWLVDFLRTRRKQKRPF